jgi:Tfp pilus assembly protein PilP
MMRAITWTIAAALLAAPLAGGLQAQAPPRPAVPSTRSAPGQTTPAPGAVAAQAHAIEPQGFTYSADGRRDPYVSLLRRGADPDRSAASARAPGLAGLGIGEVTLKGTIESSGGYVGIVLGLDSKTYIVRPGDRLLDGTIKTISNDGMVILQQVDDSLAHARAREVRKPLRQTDEAR